MSDPNLSESDEITCIEPFEDRVDILFRELELATKWKRPSVLLAIYSSEYVHADADTALEERLHALGQNACHLKIKDHENADISRQIQEMSQQENMVFFVEGLRWGTGLDHYDAYHDLNQFREFFVENQIRVVFWLTEKEAIDLAHYAPDYWAFRHRVIEFVDSPAPERLSSQVLESAWQGIGEFTSTNDDLDAKIALRTALLTDLPSGNESTDTRANLLLTLGMLHWRRGDYERAARFLNTALDMAARLEDDGFEGLCFNAIALVQTSMGRPEEAVQSYQNAIRLAPERITPWNNLGQLFRKLGRHADALEAFQKAVEHNPTDAQGWNGLGDVYHASGRNADAIHAYLKAIEYSPKSHPSWSGLGNSYFDEGQLDEALAAHQKAIEIEHRAVTSWLGLGHIHKLQGNIENASMAFRTALEMDSRIGPAWIELGNLYFSTGSYDEAMRSYQKGIEFDPDCVEAYANLAEIYSHKELHAEAVPLLLKALKLSHEQAEKAALWNHLSEAYLHLEDDEKAEAACLEAEALCPPAASPESQSTMETSSPDTPELDLSPQTSHESKPGLEPEEHKGLELSDLVEEDSFVSSILPDDPQPVSEEPDNEFGDWLDGLASVMPTAPLAETAEIASSTDEAENREQVAESALLDTVLEDEPGSTWQALDSDQPFGPAEGQTPSVSASFTEQPAGEPMPELSSETGTAAGLETAGEFGNTDIAADKEQGLSLLSQELTDNDCMGSEPLAAEEEPSRQSHVTIDEKNAQIWNELGNLYFNTGAYEEATHAFEMALELDPTCGWSYNNLAAVYFHQKRYADSIPLFQQGLQYLDDQKDQAQLWNRLGDAYRRVNEHDQAAAAYRKAMDLNPENVSLLARARFSLLANLHV